MPVMPSFTGFAPKPDIAGVMQRRAQLQQNAANAAMQFQQQRAQLAQARELAEMQAGIQERSLQQNAFESMQRLAVDREYKKGLVSIQEKKLSEQAAKAARTYDAQMGFQAAMEEIEGSAGTPEEKHQKRIGAALRFGPAGVTGVAGILSAGRPQRTIQTDPATVTLPDGTTRQVNRNTGQPWPEPRQPKPDNSEEDIVEKRQLRRDEIRSAERELDDVRKSVSDAEGNFIYEKQSKLKEEKRSDIGRTLIRKVDTGRAKVKELEARLKTLRSGGAQPTSSAAPNQEIIRVSKDGRRVVFDAATKRPLRYAD